MRRGRRAGARRKCPLVGRPRPTRAQPGRPACPQIADPRATARWHGLRQSTDAGRIHGPPASRRALRAAHRSRRTPASPRSWWRRSRSASAPTRRSSASWTRSCFGRCPCATRTRLVVLDAPGPFSGRTSTQSGHARRRSRSRCSRASATTPPSSPACSRTGRRRCTSRTARRPSSVNTDLVSGTYFPVLGLPPAAGRLLGPDDDRTPGGHPVVVLATGSSRSASAATRPWSAARVHVNGHPDDRRRRRARRVPRHRGRRRHRRVRAAGHADAGAADLAADPRRLALALAHRDGAARRTGSSRRSEARRQRRSTRSSCRRT